MAKSNVPLWYRIALSREESAQLAGLNIAMIDQAIQDGSLPYLKRGRRTLIRRTALEEWLKSQERARSEALGAMNAGEANPAGDAE